MPSSSLYLLLNSWFYKIIRVIWQYQNKRKYFQTPVYNPEFSNERADDLPIEFNNWLKWRNLSVTVLVSRLLRFASSHVPLSRASRNQAYRESRKAALRRNCRCAREFGIRANQLPGALLRHRSPYTRPGEYVHIARRKTETIVWHRTMSVFSALASNSDVYRRNTHSARKIANASGSTERRGRKSELEHSMSRKSTAVAS